MDSDQRHVDSEISEDDVNRPKSDSEVENEADEDLIENDRPYP